MYKHSGKISCMITISGFHIIAFQQLIKEWCRRKTEVVNRGNKAQRKKDRSKVSWQADARAKILYKFVGLNI